jgi:hypothetical protein
VGTDETHLAPPCKVAHYIIIYHVIDSRTTGQPGIHENSCLLLVGLKFVIELGGYILVKFWLQFG